MLLSSMAEAMYWCGRYVERAQALSRVVSSYERLSMDLPGAHALDLKPLLALVGSNDLGRTPTTRAGLLQALVFDQQSSSSVLGALNAARENLREARVMVPPELWHVLNRIHARVTEARGRSESALLEALEETLVAGQRFDGQRASGMLRDPAYAFLTIGCQLERADMLLRGLSVLLPVLHPDGWERAFDDVRWLGLLDALGLTSFYRRSHHVSADFTRLLTLVLVATDCPRSLASCLRAIERQLRALPRAGRVRAALSLAERDSLVLSGNGVEHVALDLGRVLRSLADVHAAFQASYFPSGASAAALQPAEASPGTATADPFEYLGSEHQSTDGALGVLDELARRVDLGEGIERSDLSTLVGLLTDFGGLNHHEKEEAILAPELIAHGFDCYDGPLAVMRREHRQEHYFLHTLGQLATQPEAWSAEAERGFVKIAREFCTFMRAHMDHERRDLFEQASRTLSTDAKSRLLAAFQDFDAQRRVTDAAASGLDALFSKYLARESRQVASSASV